MSKEAPNAAELQKLLVNQLLVIRSNIVYSKYRNQIFKSDEQLPQIYYFYPFRKDLN